MKPFLKWAGNKYKIIQHIQMVLPAGKRLIEPFVGTGAVFLNTQYPSYLLADTNNDLIQLFCILQEEGPEFIDYCRAFFTAAYNDQMMFYKLRTSFNAATDPRLRAALFIYLNRHCFNGLCRYNSQGKFNTPFGRYRQPYFPERELHFFYHKAEQATFQCADFVSIMQMAEPGDVVYCDPPYVPLSKTASFTSYGPNNFTRDQQLMLAQMAETLAARGIPVVISNHDMEFTREMYRKAEIKTLQVQRFISSNSNKRQKVDEILAIFC